jgi:hypothetical protein
VPLHRKYFGHHLFTTYMATVPVGAISALPPPWAGPT